MFKSRQENGKVDKQRQCLDVALESEDCRREGGGGVDGCT